MFPGNFGRPPFYGYCADHDPEGEVYWREMLKWRPDFLDDWEKR